MRAGTARDQGDLRLFLEEICCDLCRYRHVVQDGIEPENVVTTREVRLPASDVFADILIEPGNLPPYYVEIKWGHEQDETLRRLERKYGCGTGLRCRKLVVVTDLAGKEGWAATEAALRERLPPELELEVWGEAELVGQMADCFQLRVPSLGEADFQDIRDAIVRAQWRYAFGEKAEASMVLAHTLLWHFSPWRLQRIHREFGVDPDQILRPGIYRNLVIVMADLSGFSSYVRDTRDEAVVRQAMTAYYSQARQAVLDSGGMMDQFVGDETIGIFGYPQPQPSDLADALSCARRLVDIGEVVCRHWQRRLDRVQHAAGVHVGIAGGHLNLLPLRAFSRLYFTFIGDSLNMAARLMNEAHPSEIVISNSLYHALPAADRTRFEQDAHVEAKNVGLIRCWRWPAAELRPAATADAAPAPG
jgi:class 3 adenylate cyclase